VFAELSTPVLLVDVDVFGNNVRRGADRAQSLGVALRPHAKTVKAPELLRQVMAAGASGLTVSTLGEIRTLRSVSSDLLYGVPVAAGKDVPLRGAVGDDDVRVTVIVDDLANLDGVPDDPRFDVAIEIDCDGHRGGMPPDAPHLTQLAERISEHRSLRGVMTHGGGSYLVDPGGVAAVAAAEREAVLIAARRLVEIGIEPELVSVGSTPTFFAVEHLNGVTEARPGVYLFGDGSMLALGACSSEGLAVSTLATVVGRSTDGTVAFIDAGWSALSQDSGVPVLAGATGLGVVVAEGGSLGETLLVVSGANQEHGFVTRRDGGPTALAIGSRVRVYPNHACATAEHHRELVLVSGESVVERVMRPQGW
jgi:D-serine deaminase-like pyridoxal phosphate-dependent protein